MHKDSEQLISQSHFDIFIKEMIREAGAILLSYFRKHFHSSYKSEGRGVVTDADYASEKFITEQIKKQFSSHSILGEEGGLTEVRTKSGPEYLWVIDPLDGTKNFSIGNPYFNISIGLVEKTSNKNEVIAGAILQPTTQELYFAKKGFGSFCNDLPIRVSQNTDLSKGGFTTGLSSNSGAELQKVLDSIFALQNRCNGSSVRINGAAALDLALTARGVFDGFWEKKLSPWDLAAGSLLVTEAGGVCTDFLGESFDVLKHKDIIAASSFVHAEMLKTLRPILGNL